MDQIEEKNEPQHSAEFVKEGSGKAIKENARKTSGHQRREISALGMQIEQDAKVGKQSQSNRHSMLPDGSIQEGEECLNEDLVDNTDHDIDDKDDRGDHIRAKLMNKGNAAAHDHSNQNMRTKPSNGPDGRPATALQGSEQK